MYVYCVMCVQREMYWTHFSYINSPILK